jgi:hypothetical protein
MFQLMTLSMLTEINDTVRGDDGRWRFRYRKLERTHAETSAGASAMEADFSGENPIVSAS